MAIHPRGDFGEATMVVSGLASERTLDLVLRPTQDATRGMVLFPAGPFPFGFGSANETPYHASTRELPAFYLDRDEVSIGDYKAFVDETGHAAPALWGGEYDPSWSDHPVSGVTALDAEAYARWAGKRLPTFLEWQRAARGVEERTWPTGERLPVDVTELFVARPGVRPDSTLPKQEFLAAARLDLLSSTQGLGDVTRDVTPEGVEHLLGNVTEWTESLSAEAVRPGVFIPQPYVRTAAGASYAVSPFRITAALQVPQGVSDATIGFRCAKSAH
jgi:formylglycine-generating enzyme required for sulfatase activity